MPFAGNHKILPSLEDVEQNENAGCCLKKQQPLPPEFPLD